MQEISLERDSKNSGDMHCFLCGTLSRAADGKVDICDHLVYIHCQGEDLPIFDRYGIYGQNADDDGTLDKFNEKYVSFYIMSPTPDIGGNINYIYDSTGGI